MGLFFMKKAKHILVSVLIMFAIMTLLTFLTSVIIAKTGMLPRRFAPTLITLLSSLSVFLGAFLISSRVKAQGIFYGFTAAAAFVVLLILFSLAFYQNTITVSSIGKIIAILLSGSLGGILGVNRKSKVRF